MSMGQEFNIEAERPDVVSKQYTVKEPNDMLTWALEQAFDTGNDLWVDNNSDGTTTVTEVAPSRRSGLEDGPKRP